MYEIIKYKSGQKGDAIRDGFGLSYKYREVAERELLEFAKELYNDGKFPSLNDVDFEDMINNKDRFTYDVWNWEIINNK